MGKAKIDKYLQAIQAEDKNLFVPFITAGDGKDGVDNLPSRITYLQDSGVAAVELGIPFSDPVADGPTIQEASIRALKNGTSLKRVLDVLEPGKETRNVPIVLMTYVNPVFVYGVEAFAADCERVGVDGVIIPDVPMEEEELVAAALAKHSIAFIRLAALTSTPERLVEIAQRSEGFLYAVSVTGTTGVRANHQDNVADYLTTLKRHANVPVLAGFGVASSEQAHELSKYCDGVIVGSHIVDLLHKGRDEEVRKLIQDSL